MKHCSALIAAVIVATFLHAAPPSTPTSSPSTPKYDDKVFAGLELRGIGPALVSGRIVDVTVDPRDARVWYLATAAGGVWKTTNAGTTFTPVFDDQNSFSTGCVTIDPNDSLTVWVGSGENNSQRSVSYGDGVYKSTDGGKSWTNVGLAKSEHIGKIIVDPRDSNVVYVAAQGPLWNPGGDRGLYKTTDGGKSWKAVLTISENTGVTDVVFDPTNPDTLYAASYQRRRHVYTLINGGPESAIYKSTDAGATWNKLTKGLPKENMGRIGLAIPKQRPKTVYAIIEAARSSGGFFRSQDGGGNFEKMSKYSGGGAQYYAEIFVDPNVPERVYAMDVYARVSDDSGKTWKKIGETFKHVDNHVIWIDPANSDHVIMGCDGGLYESFDRTATWNYKPLPITQFYRISADDALPFYHVYGGTQDNFSLGGPSRTTTAHGIVNSDWYVTVGGDGFRSLPDPKDPNIIYGESQYGGLGRFDKRTGELLDIQPQPSGNMDPLRQNWDSPLIVSPHDSKRIYFAAQYLFRSDDRGNTWKPVSGDLTRHLDRNTLPVMGRVWGIDAVAKNVSTSLYGNIVSLSESPLQEGLIYVGTDDGLIQVTEDGGQHWRKIERFPLVPEFTYVSALQASAHDVNTVYAAFDNHKTGDFKPYVYKSTDRGATWKSITSDLPQRGSAYVVIEDTFDKNLLYAGTEFGLFISQNGGGNWIQIKGGLPTIPVRDLQIQKRRDDLVVGTFGRGIYILDDLKPLRSMTPAVANTDATLFAPRDADLYVERAPLGLPNKAFQGDAFFNAPNPPFGAVFTYYIKDELKSLKKQRAEAESRIEKDAGNEPKKQIVVPYPTLDQLRAEDRELDPAIVLVVSDDEGNVIRRVSGPVTAGFHRVAWDLRYPPPSPIELTPPEIDVFSPPPGGPLAVPGKYTVRLAKRIDGVETSLGEPKTFNVVPLYLSIMNESDRNAVLAFQKKAERLQKAVMGAARVTADALVRVQHVRRALDEIEGPDPKLVAQVNAVDKTLHDIDDALNGDPVLRGHQEADKPSLVERISNAVNGFTTTSAPTATHQESLAIAEKEFVPLLDKLRRTIEVDLAAIEKTLNERGAPWTPGRVPTYTPQ
ncbi:MAG: glycosyl hydrolase [Acidobacteria bacterium]|nr:MAG: glycosyl hydrolase [Acidobacteriota bacterium]